MKANGRKVNKSNNNSSKRKNYTQKDMLTNLPKLTNLEKAVNSTVIGQEDVVRTVCTKIYESLHFPQLKSNILLVGKSGTGKTEIIRQIAEKLNIPCIIEDSTRYTEEGYVGASVNDMIKNLIKQADGNLFKASRGIIFVDEIDKKISTGDKQSEISREGVLKALLKMVEGVKLEFPNPNYTYDQPSSMEKIKFDTSNIIFIFGGAFAGLDKIWEKRLKNNNKIGFISSEANHIVTNNYMNTSFTKEDLIQYGLLAEFVGRISSIYETRELQVEDLKKIIAYSKKSEFRKYQNILREYGIKLVYSDSLFELIAKNAKKTATGARELNSLISHIFERIMYDILSSAKIRKCTKCILKDEIVTDNTRYCWE